jgi:hypothetical protein
LQAFLALDHAMGTSGAILTIAAFNQVIQAVDTAMGIIGPYLPTPRTDQSDRNDWKDTLENQGNRPVTR